MLDQLLLPEALELAKNGATRGMIVADLRQKQRIELSVADRVADKACQIHLNQQRKKGWAALGLGTMFLLAGLSTANELPVKIPVWLGLCGSFLVFLGWMQATQKLYRTDPNRTRFS